MVEFHGREVRGSQDHVRVLDHEFPIKPSADDAVPVRAVIFQIQGIELEGCLDAMPLVVLKQFLAAIVEYPVEASFEWPLGQAVRTILVLNIRGGKSQLAINRFDVKREVAACWPMPLRVLTSHEMQEMRMVVSAGPAPALREFEIKSEEDFVRGFKRMAGAG